MDSHVASKGKAGCFSIQSHAQDKLTLRSQSYFNLAEVKHKASHTNHPGFSTSRLSQTETDGICAVTLPQNTKTPHQAMPSTSEFTSRTPPGCCLSHHKLLGIFRKLLSLFSVLAMLSLCFTLCKALYEAIQFTFIYTPPTSDTFSIC